MKKQYEDPQAERILLAGEETLATDLDPLNGKSKEKEEPPIEEEEQGL